MTKPQPTRRQQQKARTRERIFEAARAQFERFGFEGTTMRGVASEAGVATGTIFTHFPDKSALLIATLLEDLAETDRGIMETLPSSPVRAQVIHMATAGFGYWCRRPELSATLLREMYFIGGPEAERRRRETTRFVGFCRELLEEAVGRGELRPDVDCTAVAESLYSFYVGRLIRAAGDDAFHLQPMLNDMESFIDQLLAGIAPRSD